MTQILRPLLRAVAYTIAAALASQIGKAQEANPPQSAQAQKVQAEDQQKREKAELSAYEGQNVSAIQIAGRTDFDPARCTACFVQAAGQPFSLDKVEETANALKTSEHCTRVEIQAQPEANGVRIIFVLEPAVYFGIFTFPGAQRFPYSQLTLASNYPLQEAFNPSEVHSDQQTLLTFYRQ
ncbi:MAG: hypothetical protein ACRD3S_06415 [Terracidiphilus sp.]